MSGPIFRIARLLGPLKRAVAGAAVLAVLLSAVLPASAAVMTGIDVLAARGFDVLKERRVGLITNHTGRTADGISTIDVLRLAPGVRLVALFSPEHGIGGQFDQKLGSSIDPVTGLPVYSLYGASCRPTAAMLQGIDLLVFDIQDIGTRFYTYIGTLSLSMRAAREAGIPFVVLDRPNPIGGVAVAGAVPAVTAESSVQSDCEALTSIHPIPTRHGMTVGELARLFNAEFGINCDLTVVPMQGWQRGMYYDETGLAWINTSPNMRSLHAALLYSGPGTLETVNLSVGRGTEQPFEVYGAPWVDAEALLRNLSARTIPGVSFSAREFVPAGHPYRGKTCRGVGITVLDRKLFDPILTGLHLLQAFYQVQPEQLRQKQGFAIEVGDDEVWTLLTKGGRTPEEVAARWQEGTERFRELREQYLLY
jgi:uncharacterized protein YbbC (DUF1343 family)